MMREVWPYVVLGWILPTAVRADPIKTLVALPLFLLVLYGIERFVKHKLQL